MRISQIKYRQRQEEITVSATITSKNKNSESCYFRVPSQYQDWVVTDASPFAAAFLIPSMKQQEPLIIEGSISNTLYNGMQKIMRTLLSWKIGLKPIEIIAPIRPADEWKAPVTASFFSAGVDSFFTYLKNKQEVEKGTLSKDRKITHLLLVHGFDIELANKSLFNRVLHNCQTFAREENISVIPISTNAKYLVEPYIEWDWVHGGVMAGVALMLREQIKRISIAGSVAKDNLFPYGTHPDLDPLWGTETLSFIHDGNEVTRVEKVANQIAHSPQALRYLRVCNQNLKSYYNCCHCSKCLRTMMELEAAGVLDKAVTFPEALDLNLVRQLYFDSHFNYDRTAKEILHALQKQNRNPQLQAALGASLENSRKPPLTSRIRKLIATFDQRYNNRRLYRAIFKMNKQQDRNFLFKLLVSIHLIK